MTTDVRKLREAFSDPASPALLITSTNTFGEWLNLDQVHDAMAVACTPRNGLLVLDLDTPGLLDFARRFERMTTRIGDPLRIVKWETGTTSHHGKRRKPFRHQQWVLVVPEEDSTEGLRDSCLAAGLPKSSVRMGQRSRPPLAQHRQGLPTRLLHPASVQVAVDWMTGPRGKTAITVQQTPSPDLPLESGKPRRELSPEVWALAQYGNRDGKYMTGANARFGLARYLAEAGWDFEEFLAIIMSPHFAIGDSEAGRERDPVTGRVGPNRYSEARIRDRMLKVWNKAVLECVGGISRQANRDRQQHAYEVAYWGERAHAYLYANPRTKETDRQVVTALCDLLIQNGSWTIFPGARELATRANVTANTAQDCLHRLEQQGAVNLQQPSQALQLIQSTRIHVDPYWLTNAHQIVTGNPVEGWSPDLKAPDLWLPVSSHIWDAHGLGVSALRVYCELTRGWATVADLRQPTGLSRAAVERALRTLADVGEELPNPLIQGNLQHRAWVAVPLPRPAETEATIMHAVSFKDGLTIAARMAALANRHELQKKGTLGARQWESERRQVLSA